MKVRFLLDENLTPRLKAALLRYNPEIDVLRVGEAGAPPLGTLDPDILTYLEAAQRVLITDNRRSMPGHIADHFAGGRHHWGIFQVRPNAAIGQLVEAICLLAEASEAEEWKNQLRWLPL